MSTETPAGAARTARALPPVRAAVLIAVIFINILGFGIIVPLLPLYAQSLDAAPWQISLIFSAYAMGAFFGEPLWGRMSDRFGRKPLLLTTVSGNCLCYLALAYAPSVEAAFLIRFIGGMASGNFAVIQGYIADVTPPDRRARVMSWMGAAFSTGLILGPAVGGLFAQEGSGPEGFRVPMLIASALSATCVVAIALFIGESRVHDLSISQAPSRWGAIGEVATNPVIKRVVALTFLIGAAFMGVEFVLSLWGHARFDWGPREIGLIFSAVGVTSAFTQFLVAAPLSERFGEARVLAGGMTVTAVGAALMPLADSLPFVSALMCLIAFGQSAAFPNVATLISRAAPPDQLGQILGLNNSAMALSRLVGPFCAGLAFTHIGSGAPFILAALLVMPAIGLAIGAGRRAGSAAPVAVAEA